MKKYFVVFIMLVMVASAGFAVAKPGPSDEKARIKAWGPLASKLKVKLTKAEKQKIKQERKAKREALKKKKADNEARVSEGAQKMEARKKERKAKADVNALKRKSLNETGKKAKKKASGEKKPF
ncbi:MAG: hypothetical protein KKF06_04265 [Candidatus Margulisbacteria bacterium]|nr:hypothetical protein [Candidatus Margulisiibacteriota bacterium]